MFYLSGPDICGPGTKKVHVIFNYKGKNLLIKKDIRCKVSLCFFFFFFLPSFNVQPHCLLKFLQKIRTWCSTCDDELIFHKETALKMHMHNFLKEIFGWEECLPAE